MKFIPPLPKHKCKSGRKLWVSYTLLLRIDKKNKFLVKKHPNRNYAYHVNNPSIKVSDVGYILLISEKEPIPVVPENVTVRRYNKSN